MLVNQIIILKPGESGERQNKTNNENPPETFIPPFPWELIYHMNENLMRQFVFMEVFNS